MPSLPRRSKSRQEPPRSHGLARDNQLYQHPPQEEGGGKKPFASFPLPRRLVRNNSIAALRPDLPLRAYSTTTAPSSSPSPSSAPSRRKPSGPLSITITTKPPPIITAPISPLPETATATATTPSSTAGNLLRLARRKSISSVRDSAMALGFAESWNPPATANPISAAEMKKRTSIFFGLSSPPPPPRPSTPTPPTRAAPPPPICLSAFPSLPRPSPSVDLAIGLGATGGGAGVNDPGPIGMALGSPSVGVALGSPSEIAQGQQQQHPVGENHFGFQSLELLSQPQQQQQPSHNSPAFLLPPEPFGVTAPVQPPLPESREPPRTAGWRRMFGKGLFGKRSHVKSREGAAEPAPPPPPPAAALPSPPPSPPDSHSTTSTVVPSKTTKAMRREGKTARPAPCLDVDIPCVEMERYSIMFGSLLPPSEKSSLFARRRSSAVVSGVNFGDSAEDLNKQDALSILTSNSSLRPETLKPTSLEVNTLKRNATTGGSHISPRSPLSRLGDDLRRLSSESRRSGSPFALTPLPSPSGFSASPALGRSNTTAVDGRLSPIPPHPHYPPPPPPLSGLLPAQQPSFNRRETMLLHDKTFYLSAEERGPLTGVSRISEESDASTIDTPRDSFDEGDDRGMTRPGADLEPQWEMVTKNPDRDGTSNNSSRNNEAQDEVDERDEDDDLATAAQISIARQISLSQRQLLIPVVPKSQRLVSRRSIKDTMKPRLVEHRLSSMPKTAERATLETV